MSTRKNLLLENWSLDELKEILTRHQRHPLLPSYGSAVWNRVAQNPVVRELIQPLREKAITELSEPLPGLSDELYASFRKTGQRLEFERPYFERRRRLAQAVIALLTGAPDDPALPELTESALKKYTSIFEEVSWALPAHVNWHNEDVSGKEPLQIDLFCAETANLMAEVLDLLGALVPPTLQARIRARLQSQVFENYANRYDEFHWTQVTHNWNAVCHQGVLGAALSQLDDTDLLARMLFLAKKGLPLFLQGFANDGGCSEGIGYWSYGFGWFILLNEQLETRTQGELSLIEGDEHVRQIAQFGPRMALAGGKLVNFSDNGAEGYPGPALLSYMGQRFDEPSFIQESNKSYNQLIKTGINLEAQRCDVLHLSRLLLRCPEEPPVVEAQTAVDCFLPDLAVLVAHGTDSRGHVWDFAAKAGHNDEHHNHNDCAGFLLNVDGVRLIAEIGAPEYVKDFFSDKRYEFFAARSLGHSVPVINGCEQAAGAAFASRVVSQTLAPDRAEFIVDATACYPAEAECRKFVRTFSFDKLAGVLKVQDELELGKSGSLESAYIALYPIVIENEQAVIRGENVQFAIAPLEGTKLDRVETHSYHNHSGQEVSAYRLVIQPLSLSPHSHLAIEIKLI